MNGALIYFFIALGACSKKIPIPADTLVIGVEAEIRNLDLRSSSDANTIHIISLFSQSLVRPNTELLPDTDLATSFRAVDNRLFTFTLPAHAEFHDGSVLDCDDVLASFIQASGPTSRIKSSFESVKEFRCKNPLTFEIELKAPLSRFLMADVASVRILPKEISTFKGIAPPIGSGPYRFVRRTYRDLYFERFDGIHRYTQGKPQEPYFYKTLIVRTLADTSIRWLSINSGDIDALMNALSPLRVKEAQKSPRVQVIQSSGTSFQYLAINMQNAKFHDLRVRQALAYAINRDEIIKHKLFGMAVKANSPISPVNFFHNAALKDLEFAPEKSRQLLKEAGVSGLEIEIKTSTDPDAVSNVLVMAEQLRNAGFTPKVRSYEFGTFFSDITKGNYELYSLRWTAVTDPDFLQRIFHSHEFPPGRNRVYYSNPKVDQLLEAGGREANIQKRQNFYNQVQQIVLDDLPYVPLWYPANIAVLGASIKDFHPNPTGSWESLLKSRKDIN
jgi:peptide/nickel transport system substrate-binding protein